MNIPVGLDDLFLVSPLLALFFFSLIPLTLKVIRGNVEQNPTAVLLYCFMGLVLAAGLTVIGAGVNRTAFFDSLVFDGISTWTSLIVIGLTGLSLVMSLENAATRGRQFSEHVFLVMNCAIGMILVACANDLMMTFIGIEMMSLPLYMLIAMSPEERLSKEAAFKYFVLGSFASAIFLFGVAFLFGSVGSTYISDISEVAAEMSTGNPVFLIGMTLTILGFCFKVALFPFHAWTPDVYQGAPTPITAFMATAVKAVSFAAFLRLVVTEGLVGSENLLFVLQWLAVLTMLVGNIAAIMQNNFKRMLAYSSIAHSGYAMIGLIAAGLMGSEGLLGASGVIFYILAYAVMTIGAFAIISLFEKEEDSQIQIDDLKGLAKSHPWLSFALAVCMFSLAGIPPLVGFFGKLYIFSAAIKQGLIWLAVWGVINSAIGVYYYLRPVVYMYMLTPFDDRIGSIPRSFATKAAVIISVALIFAIGLASDPFYKIVVNSVAHLF